MESFKRYGLSSLRTIQLLCIAATITGFVWATSDLLLTSVLVGAPVTPLSVLLMLYGVLGSGSIEAVIRLFNRKTKRFLPPKDQEREKSG